MARKKNYKKGTDYDIFYGRKYTDYYMSSFEKNRIENKQHYFMNEKGAKKAFREFNNKLHLLKPEKNTDGNKSNRTNHLFPPKGLHNQPVMSYEEMANTPAPKNLKKKSAEEICNTIFTL
ncbi:MAG: hypothetical protein ACRCX2_26635 [Paraclostridium sp.]